jgi:hypothetical protein
MKLIFGFVIKVRFIFHTLWPGSSWAFAFESFASGYLKLLNKKAEVKLFNILKLISNRYYTL